MTATSAQVVIYSPLGLFFCMKTEMGERDCASSWSMVESDKAFGGMAFAGSGQKW